MKLLCLPALACLLTTCVFAADPTPVEQVTAAGKKLAGQPNYGWKSTVVVPESNQFKPGPTEGKAEKDGFAHISMKTFNDNTAQIVIKGAQRAVTDQDGNWKLPSELENAEGPGRFLAGMAKNFKLPPEQVADLVSGVKELKADGEALTGDLSPDVLKKQFRFGEPKDPKGSVKFWLKDGSLTKYEVKVSATMDFNGNEFDASRTTTTEIRDVGTTKVEVPADAKKKLQ